MEPDLYTIVPRTSGSMVSSSTTSGISDQITRGPAGRAAAEPLSVDLLSALQAHLNLERKAHVAYFAAAIWCAERELKGFSKFFNAESKDEHEHAAHFGDYLISRGQTVKLDVLDAPSQDWDSPEDLMGSSFIMECDVTTSLQQIYALAERSGDTRTTVFLDPLIDQQTQSEHLFAHLLGRVRFANQQPAALLIIDQELNQGENQPASLKG